MGVVGAGAEGVVDDEGDADEVGVGVAVDTDAQVDTAAWASSSDQPIPPVRSRR